MLFSRIINAKEKYYKLIGNRKFNSKIVSINSIKERFIRKNKENDSNFAYMVLNVNAIPPALYQYHVEFAIIRNNP